MAVLVEPVLGEVVAPRVGVVGEFVLDDLVAQGEGVIGVHHVGQLGVGLERGAGVDVDDCLSFFTALGGDEDDAVGTAHAEHCRCGCVFQHGYGCYGVDVYRSHGAFDAVYQHEWLCAVEGGYASDGDFGFFVTGFSGGGHGDYARQVTRESLSEACDASRAFQSLGIGLGDGAYD